MTMMVSNKLKKISDSFNVTLFDNGYSIEVSGRDDEDDWANCKIICSTIEELVELIKDINSLPVDR